MKNYQTHVYKSAYKRAYADINNALKLFTAEENIEPYDVDTTNADTYKELFKKVAQKFKASKTCFNGNNRECWEQNGEAGWAQTSESNGWKGSATSPPAFIDNSGRAWFSSGSAIIYDYNGKKGPNQLGKDRMPMR